jgi:chaperonin GroES
MKFPLKKLMESPNIFKLMSDEQVKEIVSECMEGYRADIQSRSQWSERQAAANKLALQVYEAKSFPWPGASSVKFPLITVAALQYHAKAYPSLIDGNDLVMCKVWGQDKDGKKSQRGQRISSHMSWQNLEEDSHWLEDTDRLLLAQAISGTIFRKRIWEPGPGKQKTMVVQANDLVVNYYTKNLDDSPRYTHRFYLTANNIKQRQMDGRFLEPAAAPDQGGAEDDDIKIAKEASQGVEEPEVEKTTPWWMGEQYCWWDLDGDGYEEPYVVTFDINSEVGYRMVARFLPKSIRTVDGSKWQDKAKVYKITPVRMFQKYGFIPSPDGGFYDLGLGSLMGPINASVNDSFNQIFDLGTLKALGGGFVGRGFRGKGGPITLQPGEWFPLDAPGDDIRKNIMPLPTGEAPEILFKVISFLVQYAERIVSATDLQVGENIGQNTPAQTAQTMNENGRHVYNAIYKRTWNYMKGEFRIQYDLNQLFIDQNVSLDELMGENGMLSPDDYQESRLTLCPAADPYATSSGEAEKKAEKLLAMAYKVQGINKFQATRAYLKAARFQNVEQICPQPMAPGPDGQPKPAPDFPPPPNPKVMHEQLEQQRFKLEQQDFELKKQETMINLKKEVQESQAKIMELYAKAQKLLAEAKGVETGHQIALIDAQIAAEKNHSDKLMKILDMMQKGMKDASTQGESAPGLAAGGGNATVPGGPQGNGAGTQGQVGATGL